MLQKELSHYLADSLKALQHTEGTVTTRIKEIHRSIVDLWGGAVPPAERIVAGFVTNRAQSAQPIDLWLFSQSRCYVAKQFLLEKLEVQTVSIQDGIPKMRITRHQVSQQETLAVTLGFEDGSEERLEASGANCEALRTLLREVVVPKLT